LPGARWIDRDNYHLTLRFIGDIDRHVATEVLHGLERVRRQRFSLRLDGLASLGTRKPHAIVARLASSPQLAELQGEHERIVQRLGLAPEQRKYTPHVTLARLRGAHARDIAEYLSARGAFHAGPFEVDRFVLFSSRDVTGGGPYVVEEAYPLLPVAA
jgi:RNA 2',3'-cyclic 3'-phosphodiesterase